ncbi:MAG: SLC13 family permease [Desulfomonilaceae bacterium]
MNPDIIAAIIFFMTYTGIALGSIRGLAIDRTGIAVLGAIAMLATGTLGEHEALKAINAPTILLLYSLMVLSAQFTLGGFYTRVALSIVRFVTRPELFLFALILSSALLSAVVANDIVCLAFTPVICVATVRSSLNPIPFVLALCCASNIGSAATIMGNPQNMLISQVGGLQFGSFVSWCLPPSIISLMALYLIILGMYHGKWRDESYKLSSAAYGWLKFDFYQSAKALILTTALIIMFFTRIPREISALTVAGILLCSRKMTTRSILSLVDWHLITLFCALFIVVEGVIKYGIPQSAVLLLGTLGYNINDPLVLSSVTLVLSNVVSNVPAVMLLLKNIDVGQTTNLYLLALVSSYAGNLFLIGSIANLITVEQAKIYNISVSFWSHARVGIPVTAASVFVALVWAFIVG